MPKTKQQKKEIVDKIAEKIKKAKVLVFTSFSQRGKKGLNFSAMEQLKRNLKKADAEFVVLKKTLLNLALKNLSLDKEINMDHFEGSAAALFGYSDIIEPVKILHKLSKENEAMVLYLGLTMDNPEAEPSVRYGAGKKILSKDNLVELANLPSREALFGKLAWVVNYPLSGLATVLQANIRGLAIALAQIKKYG